MNKKILIVFNPQKPNIKNFLKEFLNEIKNSFKNKIKIDVISSEKITKKVQRCDFIITLGGDGTILRVGDFAIKNEIPVAGVNLGSLGYLAEFDTKGIKKVLNDLIKENLDIQKRIVLEVNYKNKIYYAINDCIVKPLSSKVCNVELFIDDQKITEFIGDGIIIATPTGSTAYSLACGGSIVEPTTEVLLITPISPHTLSIRPIIISSKFHIKLKIPQYKSNKNLLLSLDGQKNFSLNVYDVVYIKTAEKKLLFVPNKKQTFYKILTHKLSWGKR